MNGSLLRTRYNIPVISSLLLLLFYSDALRATPACPIVTQSFQSSVNGATSDGSATGWYLDASHVAGAAYFAVQSHRIKAQTLGGEGVWYSRVFSIAGYTNVQVDAKISSEGTFTSSEYVKVYYKLNGGAETLISAQYGSFGTPTVTSPMLTGNTVQIVIRIYNVSAGNNYYYIENYDVFKETGPCTVSGISVSASASNSGVLTCTNPATTLTAGTTASGTTTYSWTGPNGYTATGSSISVSTAGAYTVTGANSAGTGSASVTVSANNSLPDLAATGANLGCATSVTISASSSVSGATYSWTGPNSFTSTAQNPSVTAAGTYTVTVRNPATGCTASRSVTVTSGTPTATTFWLEDFTLANGTTSDTGTTPWTSSTTATGTYTYSAQNNEFKTTFTGQNVGVWTSGVIDISGKSNTVISVDLRSETPGSGDLFETTDYIRVYYKLNGGAETLVYEDLAGIGASTSGTASITVSSAALNGSTLQVIIKTSNSDPTERYYFDNIKLSGTSSLDALASATSTLTCTSLSVLLTGSSSTAGVSYSWTGPNGFTSAVRNPTVTATGIYTLTVTSGGCTATDTALVSQNILAPQALTTTSIPVSSRITCSDSAVTFTAGSSTPGVSYTWTGTEGTISNAAVAVISKPGTYTLTATDPANGCMASATATVTQNTRAPEGVTTSATPATAQITCAHPSVLLTGSSTTPGVIYSWSGPDDLTATGNSLTVTVAGPYTVTVKDTTNGCITQLPATVTKNVSVPVGLSASPSDIISCYTPTIDLQGSSTTAGATFSWSGPNNYSADTAIAQTETPGNYTLTVTNPLNGCTSSTATVVRADTATPAGVTASNNGPLSCITTTVTLTANSLTSGADYLWVAPDNSFISGATAVINTAGTYTIVVTNVDNGCSSQATTTVIRNTTGCSGSTAAGKTSITNAAPTIVQGFYPNPFTSIGYITFTPATTSLVTVEVCNSYGGREKILFNGKANANQPYQLQLSAAGLAAGTHFCIIRNNGKVYSTKLILVR